MIIIRIRIRIRKSINQPTHWQINKQIIKRPKDNNNDNKQTKTQKVIKPRFPARTSLAFPLSADPSLSRPSIPVLPYLAPYALYPRIPDEPIRRLQNSFSTKCAGLIVLSCHSRIRGTVTEALWHFFFYCPCCFLFREICFLFNYLL